MKRFTILLFLLLPLLVFNQVPSTEVISADKYGSPTKWSCSDKHFGYYFAGFSLPLPVQSGIENAGRSGNFRVGYTYRYKLVDFMDIGIELAYSNRYSGIKKDSAHIFDPGGYYGSSRLRTYHNSVEGGLYLRFNLGGANHRKLGAYIDIGGFYDYAFNYGILYKTKNSNLKQKTRFKKVDYLSPEDYGVYFRIGWNYISLICSYRFGSWIEDYSTENLDFKRSPLTLGLQFNLFAR